MPKAMDPEDWKARAEAYHEASQHLMLHWTDDPRERQQAQIVSDVLERESRKCLRIAADAAAL